MTPRRRTWFNWHSWVGFNLSVLMFFVLLSGTLATLSPELDWLGNPAKRAQTHFPDDGPPLGRMLENFQRAYPQAEAQALTLPQDPWIAPELIAIGPDGARFRVFFDPASGAVQGTGRWFNWQRFLRMAHRHLMLPLEIGLTVVALLSLPLLVTFLSSLWVYKRWWRGFFRLPRRRAAKQATTGISAANDNHQRRRFWGDVHRLCGVWSLWFVLLMALTGAWYLAEHLGLNARLPALQMQPVKQSGPRLLEVQPTALDFLAQQAAEEIPAFELRQVVFDGSGGAVLLQGQARAWLVRPRANQVAFDGWSGALLDVRCGEQLDLHNRLSEAADPLHFGDFGDALTRYLWAFFGALMTLLSATGVYLYGLRALASLKVAAQSAPGIWRLAARRLPGRYGLIQYGLVLLCLLIAGYEVFWP